MKTIRVLLLVALQVASAYSWGRLRTGMRGTGWGPWASR